MSLKLIKQYEFEFEKVIKHPLVLSLFEQHVAKELNKENLNFYMQVQEYNKNPTLQEAQIIFKTYIEKHSDQELNINEPIRQKISEDLKQEKLKDLFYLAFSAALESLNNECFSRFKRSKLWFEFLFKLDKSTIEQFATPCVSISNLCLNLDDFSKTIITDKEVALAKFLLKDYYHFNILQSTKDYTWYSSEENFIAKDAQEITGYMLCSKWVTHEIKVPAKQWMLHALSSDKEGADFTLCEFIPMSAQSKYNCITYRTTFKVSSILTKREMISASATFYDNSVNAFIRVNRPLIHPNYKPSNGVIEIHMFNVEVFKEVSPTTSSYMVVSMGNVHGWAESRSLKTNAIEKLFAQMYWSGAVKHMKQYEKLYAMNKTKPVKDILRVEEQYTVNKW